MAVHLACGAMGRLCQNYFFVRQRLVWHSLWAPLFIILNIRPLIVVLLYPSKVDLHAVKTTWSQTLHTLKPGWHSMVRSQLLHLHGGLTGVKRTPAHPKNPRSPTILFWKPTPRYQLFRPIIPFRPPCCPWPVEGDAPKSLGNSEPMIRSGFNQGKWGYGQHKEVLDYILHLTTFIQPHVPEAKVPSTQSDWGLNLNFFSVAVQVDRLGEAGEIGPGKGSPDKQSAKMIQSRLEYIVCWGLGSRLLSA